MANKNRGEARCVRTAARVVGRLTATPLRWHGLSATVRLPVSPPSTATLRLPSMAARRGGRYVVLDRRARWRERTGRRARVQEISIDGSSSMPSNNRVFPAEMCCGLCLWDLRFLSPGSVFTPYSCFAWILYFGPLWVLWVPVARGADSLPPPCLLNSKRRSIRPGRRRRIPPSRSMDFVGGHFSPDLGKRLPPRIICWMLPWSRLAWICLVRKLHLVFSSLDLVRRRI
ncbi:hypothetical protein PVAP13_5KG575500 [Panicum virgatum]|uniref:Uncharacterized protein n=1 Tax=Panicum virgatum TaxID=38727 RepID=A0A8T0SNZ5_PANVG|nr:hypothetical protein PVAP13_5KG575500 [Panicum virgatum]